MATVHKIYYHSTTAKEKFTKFRNTNEDIGVHFGTLKQAEERMRDKNGTRIIKVTLDVKTPLRIRDLSHFSMDSVIHELKNMNEFSSVNFINITNIHELRKLIVGFGYDSLVYLNEKEVPEAAVHINKCKELEETFKKKYNLKNIFNVSSELKTDELYVEYLKETKRLENAIGYFAEDSVIALYPEQIHIL